MPRRRGGEKWPLGEQRVTPVLWPVSIPAPQQGTPGTFLKFPCVGWAEERHFPRRLVDGGETGGRTPGGVWSVSTGLLFSRSVVSDSLWPRGLPAARQASLSLTVSQSLPKFTSIESVMPANRPPLCCPLLLLLSIFPTGLLVSCMFIPFLGGSLGQAS